MFALRAEPPGCLFRNVALFHATAQSMGCAHTPYSMAKYWQQLRPWQDSVSLWKRAKRGATPADNTQALLFGQFPHLRGVFENPLWATVFHPDWSDEWDDLAGSIQVGGRDLDGYGGKLSRLLFDRADWPCLAVHLVLLHTHSPRYLFHRFWLAKNFTALFALSSVQLPIVYIRAQLQALLSPQSFLAEPVPVENWNYCHSFTTANENLLSLLQEWGWLQGNDQHLALLIWNFRRELECDLEMRHEHRNGQSKVGLPRPLRKKWCKKLAQWRDYPVTLNGIRCDVSQVSSSSVISPPD
jgi:hypothetical protein